MDSSKLILDPACGSRMFWFDHSHPGVLYADIRNEQHELCDGRKLKIKPDIIADFRAMPFDDESFYHVVFDPPHFNKLGKSSWMGLKYGVLGASWKEDIKSGFDECMRVLKPYGILVFKWNEAQIKIKQLLDLIPYKPLYGHTTGRSGKTIWVSFMKVPSPPHSIEIHDQVNGQHIKIIDKI